MSFENLYDAPEWEYDGAEWKRPSAGVALLVPYTPHRNFCTDVFKDLPIPEGYEIAEHLSFHDEIVLQPKPAKPPRVIREFADLWDEYGIPGDPTAFHTVYSKNGRRLLGCIIESDADGEQFLFPCYRAPDMFNHYISSGRLALVAVVYAKCN